jgi:hypothetical protein
MPLFLFIFIFYNIHTFIQSHSYNTVQCTFTLENIFVIVTLGQKVEGVDCNFNKGKKEYLPAYGMYIEAI